MVLITHDLASPRGIAACRGHGARPPRGGSRAGAALRASAAPLHEAAGGGLADAALDARRPRGGNAAGKPWHPRRRPSRATPCSPLLLDVRDLVKRYGSVAAVDGISLAMRPGESLGLVGESGSGKSTTSRLICRLIDASAGTILFEGQSIDTIPARDFHRSELRRAIQIVFQDPNDSLNPRFSAFDCIAQPLKRLTGLRGAALRTRVMESAERSGLPADLIDRFPHQLSGGQKARVGIARAIAVRPRFLILDEPTAALDVSVQATILHLLDQLRRRTTSLPVRQPRPERGADDVRPHHRPAERPGSGGRRERRALSPARNPRMPASCWPRSRISIRARPSPRPPDVASLFIPGGGAAPTRSITKGPFMRVIRTAPPSSAQSREARTARASSRA